MARVPSRQAGCLRHVARPNGVIRQFRPAPAGGPLEPALQASLRPPHHASTGYNRCVADTTAPPNPVLPFEASLEELEKVVKELEAGDLPLERSLELFEKGMSLSEICRKQLEEAETRVEMLIRKEGKIQPEPFRPEKA